MLGHDVKIIDLLKPYSISQKEFDFIVGYGFSAIKFNKENDLKLKTINYFADVIESSAAGSGFSEYNHCLYENENYSFYWDRALTQKSDYKNLYYMPLFVNIHKYKDLSLKREYDIMFAGRLDTDKRLNLIYDLAKSFPQLNIAWFAIQKHYENALKRVENPDLIRKIYRGFIENETAMSEALNKSKIVVNMNAQGESSLNYRIFEATACKTLVLTDEREELKLFNNLIPTYTSIEDLKNKISYYLENGYENITQKCHEIIVKNHESKICVEKMLKLINLE